MPSAGDTQVENSKMLIEDHRKMSTWPVASITFNRGQETFMEFVSSYFPCVARREKAPSESFRKEDAGLDGSLL